MLMRYVEAAPATAEDEAIRRARWQAFAERDASADRMFVAAVRTTGIYCRASCPAKRPKSENVVFYETCADAEAAGYRACKRCRPDAETPEATAATLVEQACRLIERAETPPDLAKLARTAGISTSHFHRVFKRVTGVTPRAYGAALRANRMMDRLNASRTISEAAFDAGYGASSRFYAAAEAQLGMSPSAYRQRGRGATIRFTIARCSLGAILVATTEKGVCAIAIDDDPDVLLRDFHERFGEAEAAGHDPAFEDTVAAVVALAEQPARGHDLPLDIQGTAFQLRVWAILRTIPPGSTATYQEIARAIGTPSASRAVAKACGANPVALAIPCHRVVRADGALSGYRWGIERKRSLLVKEGVERFTVEEVGGVKSRLSADAD